MKPGPIPFPAQGAEAPETGDPQAAVEEATPAVEGASGAGQPASPPPGPSEQAEVEELAAQAGSPGSDPLLEAEQFLTAREDLAAVDEPADRGIVSHPCEIQKPESCLVQDVPLGVGDGPELVVCVGCAERRVHVQCGFQVCIRHSIPEELATGRLCSETCLFEYLRFLVRTQPDDVKGSTAEGVLEALGVMVFLGG